MGVKLSTLAYVRRGRETLMLRRRERGETAQPVRSVPAQGQTGRWNGLGGKFEAGESPEDCLRREVLEESGLTVQAAVLKGFITFPDFDGEDDWYVFVYVVTRFSGTPMACDEGDLYWVPSADLAQLPLWDGDHHFLPWLDQPGLFTATFWYSERRYQRHEVTFHY